MTGRHRMLAASDRGATVLTHRVAPALWKHLAARRGIVFPGGATLIGRPIVELAPDSTVSVGTNALLISRSRSTALGVSRPVIIRTLRPGASIEIGSDVGMSGTTVCAALSVTIGDRVLIGADVIITDTDFHPLDTVPIRHSGLPAVPEPGDRVIVADDVFIGARSIVLKGSSIGRGSVIGAASVVTGEIPAGVVAAGNPCRVVRRLCS